MTTENQNAAAVAAAVTTPTPPDHIAEFVTAAVKVGTSNPKALREAVAALTPSEAFDAVLKLGTIKDARRILPQIPVWFGMKAALKGIESGRITQECIPERLRRDDDTPSREWAKAAVLAALAVAGPEGTKVVSEHAKGRLREFADNPRTAPQLDADAVKRAGAPCATLRDRAGAVKLVAKFGEGLTEQTIRDVLSAIVAASKSETL